MRQSESLDEDEVRGDFEKLFDVEEIPNFSAENDKNLLLNFCLVFIATFVIGVCAILYSLQFDLFQIELLPKAKPLYILPTLSRIIHQSK